MPWWTYTGTKLETADTAKENLQSIGTPLLGEIAISQQLSVSQTVSGDPAHRQGLRQCL